jgi:hypothetical protein
MSHDSDFRIRMIGSITHDRFRERVDFVLELARHLHTSGTSVNRLEGAVERVSNKLGLQVSIWSNPTGFIISFQDPVLGPPHTVTRVMRLKPGDTHLGRLSDADAIAEQVMAGTLDIASGLSRLKAMDRENAGNFNAQPDLEINPENPIIGRLEALRHRDSALAAQIAEQVYDNAMVAAGLLEDPRRMLGRLNQLIEKLLVREAGE